MLFETYCTYTANIYILEIERHGKFIEDMIVAKTFIYKHRDLCIFVFRKASSILLLFIIQTTWSVMFLISGCLKGARAQHSMM